MGKNRPRRVVVEPAAPEDPAARLEVLEALLAGVNLPFGRRGGKRPLQGTKLLVRMAMSRSRGESMMRQPSHHPAALQPKPMDMVNACLPQARAFWKA